jgi:cytochrome c oxidase subunit I+III
VKSETGFDHALYDRFPTKDPRPPGELEELERIWCAPKGLDYIKAVNNNFVGLYYVGAAFLFFCLAGLLALLMRTQLALPLNGFLGQETYNQIFTMHGTVMMFLFAVPAVEALGILLLPQMLAARDLPFPQLSAYAFWAYFLGGLAFFCSIFVGLAPNGGWFMYPPLTSAAHSPGINVDFWLLGIGFIEISAIAGAIEIIVGVLKTRAPGMSLDKLPIFAWAMLVFAVLIVLGFPAIILATLLLELERALGWPFFDALRGGDPLLWQHLFWFFGHPDVYIIFLPAAGMMSMIIPTVAQTPLVGHRLVVASMLATGFISFGVWVHHMFTTGLPAIALNFFSAASMVVAVPAGIQVFSWIATLAAGKVRWSTPALFAVGSIITFTMGGLTGVMVGLVPFDFVAHDTYFIVAHLHYVLIGGMVFPLLAGFYYWTPMISRRPLSERLGRWVFALVFTGTHVTFFPMHLVGLMGMPRRVYTYPDALGWQAFNVTSTIGAFLIAVGVAILVIDLIRNFRFDAENNAGNIFGAGTLEWLPSGLYSNRSIPVVKSRYPLWDQPGVAKDVEEGRYFLPNAAIGERETIVTSPLLAEPQYLQRMPGPGWPHVLAAVFTAGFFLLLTVQLYWPSVISGLLALGAILWWAWGLDMPIKQKDADIGAGIRVPTYVSGPRSHGWWAMVTLLTVCGMIFAMLVFSYLYLWSQRPHLFPPAQDGAELASGVALLVASLACTIAAAWTRLRSPLLSTAAILLSTGFMTGAVIMDGLGWWSAGIRPQANAHGALVYAFAAWQAVFVGVCALMACFAIARFVAGFLVRDRPMTIEALSLFLGYTALQGVAGLAITRGFPLLI